MRLGLGFLVCVLFLAPTEDYALAECTVVLDLPDDFPTELPVAVPVHLILDPEVLDRAEGSDAFELVHPQLSNDKLVVQHDSTNRDAWIVLTASAEMTGKRIEVKAIPVKQEPVLRIEARDGGYEFLEGARSILFYQSEPITRHDHTRAGFVHPLNGLDGEVFTEIFPQDHRHHQGVFWAWHQLWVGDRKVGDPWVTRDHLVTVKSARVVARGPVFAALEIDADWISPLLTDDLGNPQPIVTERTLIRLFRATGDAQYVDFTITLTPRIPEVKIGGSEDAKGYSGFTVRVKPPKDMVIEDVAGIRDQDAVQTTSPWADVYGSFAQGKTSGVAILSHPSLVQFPPRWLLRHYGMQNVAYPGREPVALSTDKPLVIRHRLVLHRGDTREARIADHQRVYEMTP